ncbi:hypothetical protein WR25_20863 [Diploscapter pachys]|uniref:Uncharacterized protein n=1 Tax=Diploscapter pachys TaxID=2018661 RepID=A0A2A2JPQ5_9BILA|nr:hypothetical protein WR25_20863 [Diploscapter pachys]
MAAPVTRSESKESIVLSMAILSLSSTFDRVSRSESNCTDGIVFLVEHGNDNVDEVFRARSANLENLAEDGEQLLENLLGDVSIGQVHGWLLISCTTRRRTAFIGTRRRRGRFFVVF